MLWDGLQPLGICLLSVVQRIGQPSLPWGYDSAKEKKPWVIHPGVEQG
jgi:hypothetical protein